MWGSEGSKHTCQSRRAGQATGTCEACRPCEPRGPCQPGAACDTAQMVFIISPVSHDASPKPRRAAIFLLHEPSERLAASKILEMLYVGQ